MVVPARRRKRLEIERCCRTAIPAKRNLNRSHLQDIPTYPPVEQNDDLKYHTDDWFRCMRSRQTTNGNIETGFAHSIAVIMATRSYREGKKIYWERKSEQIS